MKRSLLISLLVTLGVWLVFSWPLPRHFGTAIPSGGTATFTQPPAAPMEPGDHLQLLYHFWLLDDMLAGHTPWFHNLYEFNIGDDAARVEPGAYFLPFSLFFAIGDHLGGPAVGWNLAGLIALWLTYLGTLLLVRRYTDDPWVAAVTALLAITLPYRWINIAGGSPTGFTMMWVPWQLLGLDRAIRDGSWRGSLLAGASILLASWGDTHVFYFSGLMIPCWCAVALLRREPWPGRDLRTWLRLGGLLAPVALGALAAFACSKLMTREIGNTRNAAGRTIIEVLLFSPDSEGLWRWAELGVSNHIYFGLAVLLVLAALVGPLVRALRAGGRARRVGLVLLVLLLGCAGVVTLALGPRGPLHGRAFGAARKLIPHYVMIRQPAKVYCLLPSMLAVATAAGLSLVHNRRTRVALLGLLGLSAVEYRLRFSAVMCPLDLQQAAYAAAAQVNPQRPAALVLPLWPGDSHYTSVYQYYASRYRLRLVNGYRPFVPAVYIENVYHRYESANQGALTDAQLDALQAAGVGTVILHEDLFPEKVSPYPAGQTLRRLLNHPRLSLLAQDGAIWSFRIESVAQPARAPIGSRWTTAFPARHYDARRLRTRGAERLTRPTLVLGESEPYWLVRARGDGELQVQSVFDTATSPALTLPVAGTNWQWLAVRSPPVSGLQSNYLVMTPRGAAEVDYALLTAGPWSAPAPGETLTLPAPCFFHAGYTDLQDDAVVLRAGRDRQGLVFYGPKLPLPPGEYEVRVDFDSPAAAGTQLGLWLVTCPEGYELAQAPLRAGQPLALPFTLDSNLPLLLIAQFHGRGDLRIRQVHLTRRADPVP